VIGLGGAEFAFAGAGWAARLHRTSGGAPESGSQHGDDCNVPGHPLPNHGHRPVAELSTPIVSLILGAVVAAIFGTTVFRRLSDERLER
jgi:hypothetical protein